MLLRPRVGTLHQRCRRAPRLDGSLKFYLRGWLGDQIVAAM